MTSSQTKLHSFNKDTSTPSSSAPPAVPAPPASSSTPALPAPSSPPAPPAVPAPSSPPAPPAVPAPSSPPAPSAHQAPDNWSGAGHTCKISWTLLKVHQLACCCKFLLSKVCE